MDKNNLDGFTILRFAHTYRSGGGMEQHLNTLDRILLTRNKTKIIRMYLEKDSKDEKSTTKEIGQGRLVEIPMPISVGAMQYSSNKQKIKQSKISFLKTIFREVIVYNPLLYRAFFRYIIKKKYPRPGVFKVKNAGEKVRKILKEYNIDLLVMHSIGTVDSAEIIEEAKKLGIPYVFINHFSNERFTNVSIREQLFDAAGIAGVTNVALPKRLQNRFYNVSSGLDLEIFNPEQVRPLESKANISIIIYPARILPNKGQIDLIKAYTKLKSDGIYAKVVLAGRIDSIEYEQELKELVIRNRLMDDVLFLGELNQEKLCDWYRVSSVLAFPTYHQEGLPRILMEAQAMKVPPVVYIIGGTPGGLKDGKTGFLVRKGDIKTFTERLRELLTNEELRREMGEEGRKFIEKNFSLKALAERHEKFYLSVLKK